MKRHRAGMAVLLGWVTCGLSLAQITEAVLTGTVSDATGAVVAGALVKADNVTSPGPPLGSAHVADAPTWNHFTYDLNNPLRNTDPLGLYDRDCSARCDYSNEELSKRAAIQPRAPASPMRRGIPFPAVLRLALIACSVRQPPMACEANAPSYCDLVENPAKYDGAKVAISAIYNYGFEWQELLCMECRIRGKTWLEFSTDSVERVRKQLRKAPRYQGIISGRFTGVFTAGGGPYGDGSYRIKFEVQDVTDVRVIVRDWKTPLSEKNGSCRDIPVRRRR